MSGDCAGPCHDPKINLADEPTASLEVDRGLAVMRLLRRLSRDQGKAILVVAHDTRMIDEVDQVARMSDGRIVATADSFEDRTTSPQKGHYHLCSRLYNIIRG